MKSISSVLILMVLLLFTACQSQKEQLKKKMLNELAPAFSLKDLEGNEISLSRLKGKLVIIDFWATWCGPCKKSFPKMEKVIQQYKENPNVVFLFINTWEKEQAPKERIRKINQFIRENEYHFQVLLDQPIKTESGEYINNVPESYEVAKCYEIGSIPTKVVIDQNGYVRFKINGSKETAEEIFQEIEMMRDLIGASWIENSN